MDTLCGVGKTLGLDNSRIRSSPPQTEHVYLVMGVNLRQPAIE